MRKTEIALIEKIDRHLFEPSENAAKALSKDEMQVKTRWMALYAQNLEDPLMSNSEKIEFLTSGACGLFPAVSAAVAYSDIRAVNILLGNIQTASKNWIRHIFMENILEVLQKAKDKKDNVVWIMALDKLGKYAKLDKDDTDQIDFSMIIPPNFEPSDNVLLVEGAVKIENLPEYRKKLRKKFGVAEKIQDAEIIEFSEDE